MLELRRQNLLTDEELAYAIKKLKATEENKKGELTKYALEHFLLEEDNINYILEGPLKNAN